MDDEMTAGTVLEQNDRSPANGLQLRKCLIRNFELLETAKQQRNLVSNLVQSRAPDLSPRLSSDQNDRRTLFFQAFRSLGEHIFLRCCVCWHLRVLEPEVLSASRHPAQISGSNYEGVWRWGLRDS